MRDVKRKHVESMVKRKATVGTLFRNPLFYFIKSLHGKTREQAGATPFFKNPTEQLTAKLGVREATRSKAQSKEAIKNFAGFFQQASVHFLGRCL